MAGLLRYSFTSFLFLFFLFFPSFFPFSFFSPFFFFLIPSFFYSFCSSIFPLLAENRYWDQNDLSLFRTICFTFLLSLGQEKASQTTFFLDVLSLSFFSRLPFLVFFFLLLLFSSFATDFSIYSSWELGRGGLPTGISSFKAISLIRAMRALRLSLYLGKNLIDHGDLLDCDRSNAVLRLLWHGERIVMACCQSMAELGERVRK